MKLCYFFPLLTGFLLFSCSKTKQGDLFEIPVNIEQNILLPISDIIEKIDVIDLEFTNESMINPQGIKRILLCDSRVIVAENQKILVYDMNGKFIRSIGSRGQGPGEYTNIQSVALDEKNKILFLSTTNRKIICYDLNGKFLRESSIFLQAGGSVIDMNYVNNELLIVVEYYGRKDVKGRFNHSALYRLNNEMQIKDSLTIRDNYFELPGMFNNIYENAIIRADSTVYFYYSDLYSNEQNPLVSVLRDTLYRLEKNRFISELKLKFKNDGIYGGKKFIQLFNMYRSDRYIFAVYGNLLNNTYHWFCHDTKTGKGYNMENGYTDDINKIDKPVKIRPLISDTEMFYYWHTNMKPDDLEEPNPTLYIGTLKK